MSRLRRTSRRRARRIGLAGVVAGLLAVVVAPAALAQADEPLLAVREIDGTEQGAVKVTFLWSGGTAALENLTIREDGVAKPIDELTEHRRTERRMATVVAVDLSGSMNDGGALTRTKAAVTGLIDALPDGDTMAIIGFSDEVVVEATLSGDKDRLTEVVDALVAPRDGGAATFDALRQAATVLEARGDRQPNIVLVTDGPDDASSATIEDTRSAVVGSEAALFVVNLTHQGGTEEDPLRSIVERTGGDVFAGGDESTMTAAFEDADRTMRSQFVATYASTVEQGEVALTVAVGSVEQAASYVAGTEARGAATTLVTPSSNTFGPAWLRSSAGVAAALVLVGLAVGLGAYAVAALATKGETGLSAVLRPYDEGGATGAIDDDDGALAQTALLQRAVEITEDFAESQGFLVKVERMLERADLPLRAAEAIFFYGAGVVVLAILALVGLGAGPGLAVTFLVVLVPPAVVSYIAGKRAKDFVKLLPDMLSLLSGSLRAGYSLMQGIEAVSKEVEEPMGKELRRVVTEARLGRDVEDAMEAAAERMGSLDFSWAVMAVRIQREVGGNLSELLLTVADTMIQRDRLRRDVAALTAEGKISAIILGLLPLGLGGFMWTSNPDYMAPLGSTGVGQAMLGGAVLSMGIGFAWMKKTIDIKI